MLEGKHQYEIIIRVSPNDPLAENGEYVTMAVTRDPVLANAARDHYKGCMSEGGFGWVKGVAIVAGSSEFVNDAIAWQCAQHDAGRGN